MKRPAPLLTLVLLAAFAACSAGPPERPDRPGTAPVEVGGSSGKADGFDWGSPCRAGTGTFTQPIEKDAVVTVGTIPAGRVGVEIKLTSPEDVDIQLFDEDGTKVVQWPDGVLNGADQQSKTYKGVTITWSGYNGDGSNLGHEFIRLEGETANTFVMKAYGYAAGSAQVDYQWAAKPDCKDQGQGSFEQAIEKDAVVTVGTIPKGLANVRIELSSTVDIDVQLFDAIDGTAVVQWPDGLLKDPTTCSANYGAFKVTWSGYNGDGTGKGNEYIELAGTTDRALVMKVFGYEAGSARVDYRWGDTGGTTAPKVESDVIFAPAARHEDRVVELINGAQYSLDIAMYNMKHSGVSKALEAAVKRGVKVRLVYHGAQADRKDPAGTRSAALEELGVDVRYATKSKVMHHKFMLVDGPRRGADGQPVLERAKTAWLVTGSGNWALGNHDENTLFLRGVPELALHFQNEFNRLWNYSWDFEWKTFTFDEAAMLDSSTFIDDPYQGTLFTSANMKVNQTFTTISGSEVVGQAIAAELKKATTSIVVASGHMRSQTIYDALVWVKQNKPQVDIRVYVDGQEYTSGEYGDYYGYRLHAAGIPIRFKYYCYRWDYTYAPQMHNKYFVIDGAKLLSGSYNLSSNAELGSLENVVVLEGKDFAQLVQRYLADFDRLWNTDADGSALKDLEQKVKTASSIPLVFSPMALTHPQIKALKTLIAANCPAVDADADYRANPAKHKYCPR